MSDAQVPAVERRSRVAPPLKGVERAKLLDELAALHEQPFGRRCGVPPRRRRDFAGCARRRTGRSAPSSGGGRDRPRLRGDAKRRDRRIAARRTRNVRALACPDAIERAAADDCRGRRLWARHARALFGRRCPVPHARQVASRRGEGRRGAALCAVGPEAQGRPRDANDRRVPETGARRHDDPHDARRGAVHHRRQGAVRDAEDPVRQGDRRQDGGRIRRRQARRTRNPSEEGGRFALSRRAQRQGRQRGSSRPQHAVLDLQIRLPRFQSAASWSPQGCSRRGSSRCFADARNSSGACAAGSTFSPAGRRSG